MIDWSERIKGGLWSLSVLALVKFLHDLLVRVEKLETLINAIFSLTK